MKIQRLVIALTVIQPNDGGVLFRLIDQQQKPLVKLGGGADGSGLMLTGDPTRNNWSGIQVLAKPGGSTLRLLNLDGKERRPRRVPGFSVMRSGRR